jgi:hypothetical protein
MKTRDSCIGISVVLAAAVLGLCIVAAAIILVLPGNQQNWGR